MPLDTQDVRRIEPPHWANISPPRADDDFDRAVLSAIDNAKDALLAAVHSALVKYLTDEQLCFDDDNFPSSLALTGEYYISGVSHIWHAEEQVFHVAAQTNFLGKSPGPRSADDYLGLEVHLQWLPENEAFVSWRNTDSSVI